MGFAVFLANYICRSPQPFGKYTSLYSIFAAALALPGLAVFIITRKLD